MPEIVDTQIWYELEYSLQDESDWYSSNINAATEENIKIKLENETKYWPQNYKYRIVRKTLNTEVVNA